MTAQYLGRDESGTEFLLTIWDEQTAQLATRPETARTWGPPIPLVSDSQPRPCRCSVTDGGHCVLCGAGVTA